MIFGFKCYSSEIKVKKAYIIKFFAVTFLLVTGVFLLITLCRQKTLGKKTPVAENGVIDLRGWNYQTDGSIKLNGAWKFYWSKLLEPSQFNNGDIPQEACIAKVPGLWKDIRIEGKNLPDEGCATYRLLVKLDCIPENLALKVKFFISSGQVWIDNKKVYQAGLSSDTANNSQGQFKPQIVVIHPQSNQFYMTVQISNFGYADGGFLIGVELGDLYWLMHQKSLRWFVDIFIFGSILIMGLYYLTLFFLRKKEYYTLYFSITCFVMALRTLLMGQMVLYSLIPCIPLNLFLGVSAATLSIGLCFFVMYIHSLFPEDTPPWVVRMAQIVGLIYAIINIVTPDKFNILLLIPFQVYGIFTMITIMVILSKAVYLKRDIALVFFIATLSGILIVINDTLNSYGVIKTGFYVQIGQLLFIFVQSFILFKKLMKQEELLLRSELRMLQAQIKPHFLFNALNTIISVSRASSEKATELLLDLGNYLRCGFSFKDDEEFIDFDTEILHVKSYLALETARFSEKLKVIFDIDSNIKCKVPAYILQPMVENAVRHGILPLKGGGTVKLSAKAKDNLLNIVIEDDGIGMPEEKLASIIKGTDKDAGIGISNVRSRIQRIYKRKIEIKSTMKKGTVVNITIPLTKDGR